MRFGGFFPNKSSNRKLTIKHSTMDDWKIIWNSFCDEVAASVHKKNLEREFEEDIARDFFTTLGWNRFKKELKEQYTIKFATATHKADFALFTPDKEAPEVIIELKRPAKKQEKKDASQLIDYMRQELCSFGILMLGTKMEIFYIDYSTPKHEASLVETIKYLPDNEAAGHFMEVLCRSEYSSAKMLDYCHKRVKINKSVEYWCSADGKMEIMNMIVERSQLSEHLQETLRSTLQVEVKRKDGLAPIAPATIPTAEPPAQPAAKPKEVKGKATNPTNRVWMIPADSRYFNHKACFEELGQIYWKQFYKYHEGDIVYIYLSHPVMRVVYKCVVKASNLPYSKEMDAEQKYYKRPSDFEGAIQHNRFVLLSRVGETTSEELTFKKMLQHGLNGAPRGALNLSFEGFQELLTYIEENF